MTPIDSAHAEMESEAGRRAFFGLVAASELHLWLDGEPEGHAITPQLFDVEGVRFALAFDREERLAGFAAGPAPLATLPGRHLAAMLSGAGLGLGLNFGAPSETLLPPAVVAWLAEMAAATPMPGMGRLVDLAPPRLPRGAMLTLDARLAAAEGLFRRAWIAAATWEDGKSGHLLAIEEAAPGTAEAIARFVAEALVFSADDADVDVAALDPDSPLARRLARVALRFDPPEAEAAQRRDPQAPPRLR